jgi:hypothetical protein
MHQKKETPGNVIEIWRDPDVIGRLNERPVWSGICKLLTLGSQHLLSGEFDGLEL